MELACELPGGGGKVQVHQCHVNLFHLESGCIDKDKKLDDRNDKNDRQHSFVPEYLDKLFLDDIEDRSHVRPAGF